MNIKRYNPICAPLGDGSYMPEMAECANGCYYSRADLIAAGCIVAVPDGEAMDTGEIIVGSMGLEQRNYKWRDGIGYNDGLGVKSIIDHDWIDISEDEDATPVRLVPLEDVG